MRIAVFMNGLGLGGTEKAACRWARGLADRGHFVSVLALREGPRRAEFNNGRIQVKVVEATPTFIASTLRCLHPDVLHVHAPGNPHEGDVLGDALSLLPKIPVVQTNIFGKLENPREDRWTDFRLFISWTSGVQAARRSFRSPNAAFFRRASVAVYPLDPEDGPDKTACADFRKKHGVAKDEVLFGRLSRPEPNKWTDLPLMAFRRAARKNSRLKLLFREPPPAVARQLALAPDRDRFIILPATSDGEELSLTLGSLDAVLHTSLMGESFGYGIAEPMNFSKPVISNTTPWADQAQVELVRHGECGFIAGTAAVMAKAMLSLAGDVDMRIRFGAAARRHIRALSQPDESLDRLECALNAAIVGRDNPRISEDVKRSADAAAYLDTHQFGHSLTEQVALRLFHYRVRFHQWIKLNLCTTRT